jgi:hypothetical protein
LKESEYINNPFEAVHKIKDLLIFSKVEEVKIDEEEKPKINQPKESNILEDSFRKIIH